MVMSPSFLLQEVRVSQLLGPHLSGRLKGSREPLVLGNKPVYLSSAFFLGP